jgi:ABC-type Fe3+/spermidine/putrescine transport system ATPase subunit
MSNRIAVMNKGRIVQVGTPREIYQTPHSEFVAAFVGATSFVQGTVTSVDVEARQVSLDTTIGPLVSDMNIELAPGELVTIAIRPEAMRLSSDPFEGTNNIEAVVDIGLFVGDAVDYDVHVGDELLRVKGSPHTRFRRRDKVFVDVPPSECVLIRRAEEGEAELARPQDTLETVMIDTSA